jgi:hypothetical protein
MRLFRLLPAIVATALAGLAASPPLPAQAATDTTTAIAVNTRDGAYVFRFSMSARPLPGSTVSPGNAAVAAASCTDCETVAISFQVVFATSEAIQTFTPTNLALADNTLCDSCLTIANAYQAVVGTGGPIHLTALGHQTLAEVRQEVDALRNSPPSLDEVEAVVADAIAKLQWIIATQVVAVGPA